MVLICCLGCWICRSWLRCFCVCVCWWNMWFRWNWCVVLSCWLMKCLVSVLVRCCVSWKSFFDFFLDFFCCCLDLFL